MTDLHFDLTQELRDKREGKDSDYTWVLASDCRGEEGITGWCPLEQFLELSPFVALSDDCVTRKNETREGHLIKVKRVKVM